jgi:hypothetical protein
MSCEHLFAVAMSRTGSIHHKGEGKCQKFFFFIGGFARVFSVFSVLFAPCCLGPAQPSVVSHELEDCHQV